MKQSVGKCKQINFYSLCVHSFIDLFRKDVSPLFRIKHLILKQDLHTFDIAEYPSKFENIILNSNIHLKHIK